jgi:hypothetical protein
MMKLLKPLKILTMEHLTKSTREIVAKSNDERIKFIRGQKWVGYTKAQEVLQRFEDILSQPPIHRMPSVLLIGESNNGKTEIIKKFQKTHQAVISENEDKVIAPVLIIEAPSEPDEKRLYQKILSATVVPFRSNHKPEILYNQVSHTLRTIELKVLIIDEIHNVLSGRTNNRQVFLNALKSLSNDLMISIIAVGTKDAFHVFQSDPQMANRFDPVPLQRWQMDNEYLRLLVSYEKLLPLKEKSDLANRPLASKILSLTDGTIGGITGIIKKASVKAIQNGQEKISMDLVQSLEVMLPHERNRMPAM